MPLVVTTLLRRCAGLPVCGGSAGRRYARYLCAGMVAALLSLNLTAPAAAKYASIVIDAQTGNVLYARNADTRNYPASLTKMMTLFLLFEAIEAGRLKLDQALPVSRRAAGQAPSKLGLKQNQTIRVETAIRALAVKSANDVATVVAEALGGSEFKFAQIMTERARQLGMRNTTFRNASGLPNRRQLSTARDMAILAKALLDQYPQYYGYFSEDQFAYKGRNYRNHNSLMRRIDEVDGIKTGYIRASGFNLVASAHRDGYRLIGVVFGGKDARSRDKHMETLLERSWQVARATSTVLAQPQPRPEQPGQDSTTPPENRETATAAIDAPTRPAVPRAAAVARTTTVTARKPATAATQNTFALATPATVKTAPPQATPVKSSWGIQVGAFSGYNRAQAAAGNATSRLSGMPATAAIEIDPFESENATLFRSRITGLNERLARSFCRRLTKYGDSCTVVVPETSAQIAGNPKN